MSLAGHVIRAVAGVLAAAGTAVAFPHGFNEPGNILISDQLNNRVIEISSSGEIVWQFGIGPDDISATSPIGVNDAQRIDTKTLIAAAGAPPGSEPLCRSGCADNRVMLVDANGKVIWQYGRFGVAGSKPDQLSTPVQATWTPSHTVLITDQQNQRIIEVSLDKRIRWQYGTTGVAGQASNQLNSPNSAELLDNGHFLIADQSNNRVIEVTRAHRIVATFTAGGSISAAAYASRLPNGDTLITDSNNNRIVEVDPSDRVVWSYVTNTQSGSNPAPLPSRALRLENGETLISDQFNHRIISVSQSGRIVRQYGTMNVAGSDTKSAQSALNAPFDAKKIGDYTGLTWSDSLHLIPSH